MGSIILLDLVHEHGTFFRAYGLFGYLEVRVGTRDYAHATLDRA
jgi:hypothetical protein